MAIEHCFSMYGSWTMQPSQDYSNVKLTIYFFIYLLNNYYCIDMFPRHQVRTALTLNDFLASRSVELRISL